ncbi:MAG: hypothetical protein ACD_58C00206G0010 [uncultured bacterium]|nr:MAG: hypothetical protein ACD_58C00206G0010 [uncultured bacterium]
MNNLIISLEINNKTKYKLDKKQITDNIKLVLKKNKFTGKIEVGIQFVPTKTIRSLNNKYRQIDSETDVLSFPTNNKITSNVINNLTNNLGDIIVCPDYAIKILKIWHNDWSKYSVLDKSKLVNKEIEFLIIHGLKHLIGIHHRE